MTYHGRFPGRPLSEPAPNPTNPSGGAPSAPAPAHTAAARRTAVALFGKPGDSGFDEEWLAKRVAVIDRETRLPEMLSVLERCESILQRLAESVVSHDNVYRPLLVDLRRVLPRAVHRPGRWTNFEPSNPRRG